MTWRLPTVLLAAAHGTGEEEGLSEVFLHHIANSYYEHPTLAAFGVSKGVIMMLLAAGILILLLGWSLRKSRISNGAPRGLTNAVETVVVFVRDEIAITYMGRKYGSFFAPYLLTLFFFILTCNLLGLFPFAYTATSNLNVTATLATITLVMIIVSGMVVQGPIGYIKHMVPPGTPIAVTPIVFLIEIISMLVKPIALTIRLGANMTAGHIAILVMISFVFIFKSMWIGFLSVPLAVGICLLEIIVALIQAYVFTLLSALFIGMVVHSPH